MIFKKAIVELNCWIVTIQMITDRCFGKIRMLSTNACILYSTFYIL